MPKEHSGSEIIDHEHTAPLGAIWSGTICFLFSFDTLLNATNKQLLYILSSD